MASLLDKAVENNTRNGITGVLCYSSRYFGQILEGDVLPVMDTYRKIAGDSRHSEIVLLSLATVESQMFKGWAMGGVRDEQSPDLKIDSILELRERSPKQSDAARNLMQRWLKLLQSSSVGH